MNKNIMPEIATLLGVEIGEEFIIQNADRKETVVLAMDGFHVIQPNYAVGPDHGKLLSKVLQGLYEVNKVPWEPQYGEVYYWPSTIRQEVRIEYFNWRGDAFDLAMKALGMVYKTKKEALEHFAEDYERLTGKKLEE